MGEISHTKVLSQSIVVITLLFRGFSRSERERRNIFECENRLGPRPSTRMVHGSTGISICQCNITNKGEGGGGHEEALATATEDRGGASFLELSFLTSHSEELTPRREQRWG